MHRSRLAATFFTALVLAILCLLSAAAAAPAPKALHSFAVSPNDGSSVYSSLTQDSSGNLYGTTVDGGKYGEGTVFKLSPTKSGSWKETILYSFTGELDGANPHSAIAIDARGNVYGTTVSGGLNANKCNAGCGVVFQLSPDAGSWIQTVLYQFTGGVDGGTMYSGVILDSDGNLYGTTMTGGSKGLGTIFELTPTDGTTWQLATLYNFGGKPDAAAAYATLIFDAAGNLYGTTYEGGANNQGAVYKLTRESSGTWAEQVLYSFKGGNDGDEPFAGVILDQAGNLYGTTIEGGTANVGTAYVLTAANGWKKTILHQFLGLSAADGANPNGLIFDASGNLYGTTVGGGKYNPGTIFRLTPNSGRWKETVLYSFTGGNDGAYPSAGLTMDAAGHLYGTTLWGGPAGDTVGGVAFEFIP
jgi:uncharacterized repeat protein (TIGR03803 family)